MGFSESKNGNHCIKDPHDTPSYLLYDDLLHTLNDFRKSEVYSISMGIFCNHRAIYSASYDVGFVSRIWGKFKELPQFGDII